MSSATNRVEREKQKQIQEKCQAILGQLLREEDNKYCVDCDAKGPRWASWNLGIFLCIRCAGIHRNLGVHISKVKSVNLDTWTPEQVACLQQMGNSKARAVYEANLPDNFRRPQTDSSLEAFIRVKYEQKKYIAKEWVPPPAPKPAFDIEEEHKREKERRRSKKTGTSTGGGSSVEIPVLQQPSALPRPHSGGNASVSTVPASQESSEIVQLPPQQQQSSVDLLSLDLPTNQSVEDPFDAFLSATPASAQIPSTTPAATVTSSSTVQSANKSSDESDFFNQTSGDTPKKSLMTKESILSLYGPVASQAQQSQQQQQQPVFGIPGGLYVGHQVYSAPPIPGMAVQSSAPGIPNGVAGSVPQGVNVQPLSNMATTNPFLSVGTTNVNARLDWGQQPGPWVAAPGGGTNPALMAQGLGQLQQRMANLQLSGQPWNVGGVLQPPQAGLIVGTTPPGASWPVAPHGQTLSTNLWQ